MNWARKGLLHLLALILFLALIGTAFSTSTNIAFSHPNKIENWLNQSHFYDHFVGYMINQAQKSASSNENQGSVTLSDSSVQQAAITAFTPQLVQQSVNKFLDSNYAWLEGKTAQPSFVIDLTNNKQNFANLVGQYVQQHIDSLPACTPQQVAELGSIENADPLNITCKPRGLDSQAEAALVSQRVANSNDFLSNPIISANNVSANGSNAGQPYYQQYSSLPKLYKLGVRLPLVYAGIALLSILCLVLVATPRRLGVKRVGIVFAIAGVILVILEPLFSATIHNLERHILKTSSLGQLQQSITDVLHRAGHQWTAVDLWFGVAFLAIGAVIFVVLNRARLATPKVPSQPKPSDEPNASDAEAQPPAGPGAKPTQPVPAEKADTTPAATANFRKSPASGPPPRPKKPPRLIQ